MASSNRSLKSGAPPNQSFSVQGFKRLRVTTAYSLDIDQAIFYVPSLLSFSTAFCKLHFRSTVFSMASVDLRHQWNVQYLYLQKVEAGLQNVHETSSWLWDYHSGDLISLTVWSNTSFFVLPTASPA